MNALCRFALAAVLCGVAVPAVSAQQAAPAKDPQAAAAKPDQKPAPKPDQPADQPKYEEVVVVSASRERWNIAVRLAGTRCRRRSCASAEGMQVAALAVHIAAALELIRSR